MSEKYRAINYRLLPEDIKVGENPKRLSDLLRDAPILFVGVAKEWWIVPAPGDLVEYDDQEKLKHPGELKLLKELGFYDGNISGTYRVIARGFHEPKMDEMMINLVTISIQ